MKQLIYTLLVVCAIATSSFAQMTTTMDHINASCLGPDGRAWVRVTGGTTPYTYTWSGGTQNLGGDSILNLAMGTYFVTVTDAGGATATDSVVVADTIEYVFNSMPQIFCPTPPYLLDAAAADDMGSNYDYIWTGDFLPALPSSGVGSAGTAQTPGQYTVTIINRITGCSVSDTIDVVADSTLLYNITTTLQDTCLGIWCASGPLSIFNPYTYLWSTGETTRQVCGLTNGTYTLTVDNGQGCVTPKTITINSNPLTITSTVTNATCTTPGLLSATASGGTPPYTYMWSNGATTPTINTLFAGDYIVWVYDSNGCYIDDTVTVTVINTFNPTVTTTYDTCAGTACLTAQTLPNAQYYWSNNAITPQICNLTDASYSVTITTINGCTAASSYTITNAPTVSVNASSTPSSCGNDGSVSATAVGGTSPYTYLWNNSDTTATINNLPAGNYSVTVTDASGCTSSDTVTIASGSFVLDSVTTVAATCATAPIGSATVYVQGTNGPFTYDWGSGPTSNNTLNNIASGTYVVTVTDQGGCTLVQTVQVPASGLQIMVSATSNAGCDNSSGAATVTVVNGTAPVICSWSNGAQTGTSINFLAQGIYTVTVTDANGCNGTGSVVITSPISCLTRVGGKVYIDTDSDCNFTAADRGLANRMVHFSPGFYAYTNYFGDWNVLVPQGQTYQASVYLGNQAMPLLSSCGIDTITVNVPDSVAITNVDFPTTTNVNTDVMATISCGSFRVGSTRNLTIQLRNNGLTTTDISGVLELDSAFTSATIPAIPLGFVVDSITSNPVAVYFRYNGLPPQLDATLTVSVSLPPIPAVNLGQILHNSINITVTNLTDEYLPNNEYACISTVVGAYDPNDKQVTSNGNNVDGTAMVEDTLLRYHIRFQNTGTDTAFTVTVVDTLDSYLNVPTFRLISASHDVEVEFYDEHIVHFVFNNIMLPDSNVNEPLSHGYVEFEIEILDKTELDPVSNQAAIYFDSNPPIFTNTVTTQRQLVGIAETPLVPVNVFPNPTSGKLSVNLGGMPVEQVELYDMMGRKVLSQNYQNVIQADIDANELAEGMYMARIRSDADWYVDRILIAK